MAHNKATNSNQSISFGAKQLGPYYWVGTCNNGISYFAGQTFMPPVSGILTRIALYTAVVDATAEATLEIYSFDKLQYQWKEKQAEISQLIAKGDEAHWLNFILPPLPVSARENYGFKLSCKGGMVAIAECPWNIINPYPAGEEWTGSSVSSEGSFNEDFDFAFEGEILLRPDAEFI